MTRSRHTQTVVVPATRRVVRYRIDSVGNDLGAHLAWCATHDEPLWIFNDRSYECPWTTTTGDRGEHVITAGPWELP